tara:strand:- start:6144 stop:6389 length:246 start_codon:yes stop_codon:yes gene_type:complete
MLKADGFDEAIMGVVQRFGQETVILYDTDKLIDILVQRDEMPYDDAVEFFEYNILGSWVGEETPAFFSGTTLEQLEEEDLL